MMAFQIPDRRIHKQRLGRSESYVVLLEKRRSIFSSQSRINRQRRAGGANEDLFSHKLRPRAAAFQ